MSVSFLPLSLAQEVDRFILHPQEEERVAPCWVPPLWGEVITSSLETTQSRFKGWWWGHCKQADYSWCPRMKLSSWREIRSSERNMVYGDTLRTTGSSLCFFFSFFLWIKFGLTVIYFLKLQLCELLITSSLYHPLSQIEPAFLICCCSVPVMFDFLQPHGLQHPRLRCPSLSPGACSSSCPLSWWCKPTISSSVTPNWQRLQCSRQQTPKAALAEGSSWGQSQGGRLLYSHQGENLPTKFASKTNMQNVEDWLLHAYISKAL